MWSVRASSAAPYQCCSGTALGGWLETDELAVKLVVTDDEVGLSDDERILILQVDSAELNFFPGLDVDKCGYRIGVPRFMTINLTMRPSSELLAEDGHPEKMLFVSALGTLMELPCLGLIRVMQPSLLDFAVRLASLKSWSLK